MVELNFSKVVNGLDDDPIKHGMAMWKLDRGGLRHMVLGVVSVVRVKGAIGKRS